MRPYVVAVSGGVDSMVLLHQLLQTLPKKALIVAHFDHRLRGQASNQDRLFVEKIAKRYGFPFEVGFRKGAGVSEDSLRKERYAFLRAVKVKYKAQGIILAHHQDDQIETLFMNLLRGSSLKGLGGLKRKNGALIRPLLDCTKQELLEYARAHKVLFREDASNQDAVYFRNRIRHSVLPVFFKAGSLFGNEAQLKSRISQTMRDCSKASKLLTKIARHELQRITQSHPLWFRIPLEGYEQTEKSLRPWILSEIYRLLGVKDFTRSDISRMRSALTKRKKEIHLTGKVRLRISCGVAFFQNLEQQEAERQFKPVAPRDFILSEDDEIRFFTPGDKYRGKKLKFYFLEQRIPEPERKLIPLISKKDSSLVKSLLSVG